jgi:phytoene/squalene synthetase
MITIDGLTQREVVFNIYAMARTMREIERKLERARSEKVIAKLKRRWWDEKIGWENNMRRLGQFK